MGGATTSPTENDSYLRKTRKPVIEKRRRKRMNQSIDQLKELITDTIKDNVAPMTRVDKADILELTVAHLTQANQRQHRNVTPETSTSGYSHGYQDCSQDIINFLASNSLVNGATLNCLNTFMNSSYLHQSGNGQTSRPHSPSEIYCSTPMRHRSVEAKTMNPAQMSSFSPIFQSITNISDIRNNVSTCSTSSSVTCFITDSSGDSESYSSMDYSSIEAQSSGVEAQRSDVEAQRSVQKAHSSGLGAQNSGLEAQGSCLVAQSSGLEALSSEIHHSSDSVSIGDGKDSAIGNLIKDTTWRPW